MQYAKLSYNQQRSHGGELLVLRCQLKERSSARHREQRSPKVFHRVL